MDILILSREFPPYVLGGISYHLCNLYREISKRGHDITVLAGKCPQSYHELEGEIPDSITVEPVQFGYRKGYSVLYPAALKLKLMDFDTSDFDIAVSHTPLPYEIDDRPLVSKYHDCTPETRRYMREGLSKFEKIGDSILHPFRSSIEQKSLSHTDHAIFNSHVNKEGWLSNYNEDVEFSVIHNGVDVDKFHPEDTKQGDYALFVGSSTQKGLDRVRNYADLYAKPVHIVGSVQVNHENIKCHGRVNQQELAQLYSRAAVTIHPAHFESFGNIILESLACGTPVVTTPECGASEVLTSDVGIITQDLECGVDQATTLKSEDCRNVAKNHQWESIASQTMDVLSNLAD